MNMWRIEEIYILDEMKGKFLSVILSKSTEHGLETLEWSAPYREQQKEIFNTLWMKTTGERLVTLKEFVEMIEDKHGDS